MDRSNLFQVNRLYDEANAIGQALQGFDNGGRIVAMSVSFGPLLEPTEQAPIVRPMSAMVDVSGIEYPQAMVDAIRTSLQQRLAAINAELQQLGLTGAA